MNDLLREHRRARLQLLIAERYGGETGPLLDALGAGSRSLVPAILRREKTLGDGLVLRIEKAAGLPGWFAAPSDIGGRVAELRELSNHVLRIVDRAVAAWGSASRDAWALEVGLDPELLAKIETRHFMPALDVVAKIARAAGTTLHQMFDAEAPAELSLPPAGQEGGRDDRPHHGTFGQRLQWALTLRGLSQSELARAIVDRETGRPIRQATVSHLVRAKARGSRFTPQFARELKVSESWLRSGEGEPWDGAGCIDGWLATAVATIAGHLSGLPEAKVRALAELLEVELPPRP